MEPWRSDWVHANAEKLKAVNTGTGVFLCFKQINPSFEANKSFEVECIFLEVKYRVWRTPELTGGKSSVRLLVGGIALLAPGFVITIGRVSLHFGGWVCIWYHGLKVPLKRDEFVVVQGVEFCAESDQVCSQQDESPSLCWPRVLKGTLRKPNTSLCIITLLYINFWGCVLPQRQFPSSFLNV